MAYTMSFTIDVSNPGEYYSTQVGHTSVSNPNISLIWESATLTYLFYFSYSQVTSFTTYYLLIFPIAYYLLIFFLLKLLNTAKKPFGS